MATLTPTQLDRLRRDLGDVNTPPAFSDAELQDNWDRMSSAEDEFTQHNATLALCFWQLLVQANKFHNYTAGAVTGNLQQVRDNLKQTYDLLAPYIDAAQGAQSQISFGKIGRRVNQERTIPTDDYDNRTFINGKPNRLS